MNGLWLLALIVFGMLWAGLASLQAGVFALALPPALLLLADLLSRPEPPRLTVRRSFSPLRILPGSEVNVRVEITNAGDSLEAVWLEDGVPFGIDLTAGTNRRLTALGAGQTTTLEYTLYARRGVYRFPGLHVRAGGWLSLQPHKLDLPGDEQLIVLPETMHLPLITIRPPVVRGFSGIIPARRGGAGNTFYSLRSYHPGDSQRRINWRVSARHEDQLYSNDFQQESAAQVVVVLDARRASYLLAGVEGLFEYAVLAASSLAQAFLHQGDRVGLIYFGRFIGWTYPGYGRLHFERILQALAQANLGSSEVDQMDSLPARFFPPGAQIVMVSPLIGEDVEKLLRLRARRHPVLVVSPDPLRFEAARLPDSPHMALALRLAHLERAMMLRPLRRAGVQVLDWDVEQPLAQAIQVLRRTPVPYTGGRR